MRIIGGVIAALAAMLAFASVAQAATLKADYRLENSLKSSVAGAPALTNAPLESCTGNGPNTFSTVSINSRTVPVLDFQKDGGLFGPAAPAQDNYSIVLLFEFSSTSSGYRRILDFSNSTSDAGLYLFTSGVLEFYPIASGLTPFTLDTWHQVVLTRNSTTKSVAAYLDGSLEFTFDDTGSAALDPTDTIFFQDNNAGGSACEAAPGSVARIRLYRGALSASQVSALAALPPVQAIGLSATSGKVGSKTTVTGSDFGPLENVTLKFRQGSTTTLVTVKTDHTGAFSQLVTIPAGATTGAASIVATGKTSKLTGTKAFTVTP